MRTRIAVDQLESYLAATVIFLAFFALRLATLRVTNGDPYIAFLPASILSTVMLGIGPGLLTGALGGLAGLYYITPPAFSFRVERVADLGDLGVYAGLCLGCCWLVHMLRKGWAARK